MVHARYDVVTSPSAPVVHTTGGDVVGRWQNASSAAYLGIPFAAPPVGELRFAAPRPYPAWDGVRPATEYGPTAQRRPFGDQPTIPEPSIPGDRTLNVNVFTPAPRDRRANLPVYVWIHGGGFYAGSPASPWYNGRSFNADGVVTVSISYRLGFQGFGWVDDAPLNRGLLDQIAALTWVHDNIRQFGGDPDQVTIGGQSAGGGSVLALLASPKASGLFRGAISESGCMNAVTVEQAERIGRDFAQAVGVQPTVRGWSSVGEDVIVDNERRFAQIDEVPSGSCTSAGLFDELDRGYIGVSNLAYAPTVDGDVLTSCPYDAYVHGAGRGVSLLMGTVRDEFSGPIPTDESLDDVEHALHDRGLSDAAVERFSSEVRRIGVDRLGGQLVTTSMFHLVVANVARIRRETGAGSRTWLYDFAQMTSNENATMHCAEIPYAFDVLDEPQAVKVLGRDPSQHLADTVHGRWVEFIRDGAINAPTVDDHACGALRFQGGERYDAEAYRFVTELMRTASGVAA